MNTFNVEIALPESFAFTSRGVTVELNATTLPVELIQQAVEHGLGQVIGDAAAGAVAAAYEAEHGAKAAKAATRADRKAFADANEEAVADMTRSLMEKKIATLESGEWATRAAAGTSDPLDAYRIQALRPTISPDGANGKTLAALATSGEQNRFILSLYADALTADQRAAVDARAADLKRIADERAKARKATKGLVSL